MKEEILKLKNNEIYIVTKSDYGKAEIRRIDEGFALFEIPMYGGEPMYVGSYVLKDIYKMIKEIESWT